MANWTLKVRDGSQIERTRFTDLDKALRALERRLKELEPTSHREDVHLLKRKIDASRLVAVRVELSGPGRFQPAFRGGIDLRGDGSMEAFTGRSRRTLIEAGKRESPAQALRRAATAAAGQGATAASGTR
ncbi:MAG TPA: hypothetical protein VHW26_00585 [Solirubrobacteraceae bacterium]|jgi:hypothetical protein|nr:hypothetical protein [Solirubrobacteraceae bacterium]